MTLIPLAFVALVAADPKPVFHATFDGSLDAKIAAGDSKIYSAPSYKQQSKATPGLSSASAFAALAKGAGRNGSDALRFAKRNKAAVFFKAQGNIPFNPKNWTGTFSFWLKVDPETEIERDYCDPIQLTDKAYNDSAIWVDFTKDERPRHFRLGAFGSLKQWNPENKNNNPDFDKRLVVVKQPPFSKDRWTHIAIVYQGLGGGSGTAKLYVNGKLQGESPKIAESFDWDLSKAAIRLGVEYTGLMDDVAVYATALDDNQIAAMASR